MDSARTVGTLAGVGLLTAPGLGTAYAAIGLCYVTGFLLTFGVRTPRRAVAAARGGERALIR